MLCGACGKAGPPGTAMRRLWLEADFRGHSLWAYNAEHLAYLEGYVAAGLRETPSGVPSETLESALPQWLVSAKNRDEVLRQFGRMRALLDG